MQSATKGSRAGDGAGRHLVREQDAKDVSLGLKRRSAETRCLLDPTGFGVQIYRREQARLPYDGVACAFRQCSIPTRQFPQHLRLDRRLDVNGAQIGDSQTDASEPAAFVCLA